METEAAIQEPPGQPVIEDDLRVTLERIARSHTEPAGRVDRERNLLVYA